MTANQSDRGITLDGKRTVISRMAESAGDGMTPIPTHALLVTGSRTWSDENAMRSAFREVWLDWHASTQPVFRPLLISGNCPTGADHMAEQLWETQGLTVHRYPADWSVGKAAGPARNQTMVDELVRLRTNGVETRCVAFLEPCMKTGCAQRARHPGHFSHGTIDCRRRAWSASIPILDVTTGTQS